MVTPYLYFDGCCEEALDFYQKKLGAVIQIMMRFSDCPEPPAPDMIPPESEHKIMHAGFKIGDSFLMASDGNCRGEARFQGISLSLTVETPVEAERLFSALSEDGQVQMSMAPTFFAPAFGMVADKFGVSWMVIAAPPA